MSGTPDVDVLRARSFETLRSLRMTSGWVLVGFGFDFDEGTAARRSMGVDVLAESNAGSLDYARDDRG